MRDWHHKTINLDQATQLVATVTPTNEVVIGVADGGILSLRL